VRNTWKVLKFGTEEVGDHLAGLCEKNNYIYSQGGKEYLT
jgi:hypothetical protein